MKRRNNMSNTIKFNRQTATDQLSEFAKEAAQLVEDSGLVKVHDHVTVKNYIDKGVRMADYFCHHCNHTFTEESHSAYYYSSTTKCPNCGNNSITSQPHVTDRERRLYVVEEDDGFKFVVFYTTDCFPDGPTWHTQKPRLRASVDYVGMFKKNVGWFVYSINEYKLLRRDSQAEVSALNRVRGMTPINDLDEDFSIYLAEAATYEAARTVKSATKRASSKTTMLETMHSKYRCGDIDEVMLVEKTHSLLTDVYSTVGNVTTHSVCCTKCGYTYQSILGDHRNAKCPHCNTSYNDENGHISCYTKSTSSYVAVFENTNLPDNDLLVRLFDVRHEYSASNGLTRTIGEKQRIFFGKKIYVYTNGSKYGPTPKIPNFAKSTVRDISSNLAGWRINAITAQDNDELIQIVRNSCLAYSGLIESWGIGDPRYIGIEQAPSLRYLTAWYKSPAIELIMKANMTNYVEDILRDPDRINNEGTTLADALRTKPQVAKIAAKLNLSYNQTNDLHHLFNADNTITAELFVEMINRRLNAHQLITLKTQYDITYAQTMKYLTAVYDHQCIDNGEAMSLWVDYLRMASQLRIDLTDKARKYPGSLKKEHDVATFAYKAVQIELDKEQFAKQAEINAGAYEYSYKDMLVIVPKTPQAIVEEATRQKNCLRSYVERVKNGDTVVVFIRRKIMPEVTYVTAEVHDGQLVQLKGYCNSNPRNKELMEFVQHWAKAKDIRIEC